MEIARLLNDTLNPDGNVVRTATESLDRLSHLPHFPLTLLSISTGGEGQGQRISAATYLKNFTRRNVDTETSNSNVSKEFKDQLIRTLLQAEPVALKVLVEVFRIVVIAEFVKQNSWPEIVPDLRYAIQNSNMFSSSGDCGWNTINALSVLQSLVRPFQYFLNPKVTKEPVPPQLEIIAEEILVPLLATFHHLVEKALSSPDGRQIQINQALLIICKTMHLTVRSHMPSALIPLLPSFCHNLIGLLDSLSFDYGLTPEDGCLLRLKTGKRSLLILCTLITRHRKYSDRLMPAIINCALKIVKYSTLISKLDFLAERVLSLAFDVISHVLETGPGWRLVSPHFSFLLDSAIFPAITLNEKDISEWEDDTEEYIRKNLPSELEEISGWRDDLFTARKSAMNLLGVISMSKGPPPGPTNASSALSKRKKGEKNKRKNQLCFMGELLVFPFLSKFPVPLDANTPGTRILNDYFGVLVAYGGLQDFLREQKPAYVTNLIRTRILPLYATSVSTPYLVASANWVVGELAPCLTEEINVEVYTVLLKTLTMPDKGDTNYYPVRVSAAGAIAGLLQNEYPPPEWLPLLQVVISGINVEVETEDTSLLLQLLGSVVEAGDESIADHIPLMISSLAGALSKHIHPDMETWPQVVEKGFTTLAVMTQSWESFVPEEDEEVESSEKWASGRITIGKALAALLQQTWLTTVDGVDEEIEVSSTPLCLDYASKLVHAVIQSVTRVDLIHHLKLAELLLVWVDLIADWHAWEESEDLSVFDCIKEVVSLQSKYELRNLIITQMPLPPAPPVPRRSVIEGMGAFVSEAILQYPSATWRACSCAHMLLHVPSYSLETEGVKHSLAGAFSHAAFSRFRKILNKTSPLRKPLLLVISSCYLYYPDTVETLLEKAIDGGFMTWASALAFVCTSSFEPGLAAQTELKLAVMTLVKLIEKLIGQQHSNSDLLRDTFNSLMEASTRLKGVQEEMEEDEDDNGEAECDDDDDGCSNDDEDSEEDEHEETQEEFLERYAKAAEELESGLIVEEGDIEDQDHDIALGLLDEEDEERAVSSLMQRFAHVLVQQQSSQSEVVSSFLNSFPQYKLFFQQ